MTMTNHIPSFAQAVYAGIVSKRHAGLAYREAWDAAKDDAGRDAVKFGAHVACIAAQLAKIDAAKALKVADLKCSDALWTEALRIKGLSVKARQAEGAAFQIVRTADVDHLRIRGAAGLIEAPAKSDGVKSKTGKKVATIGKGATKDAAAPTQAVPLELINKALQGARAKSRGDVEQHVMALCVDAEHFPKENARVWPVGVKGDAYRKALANFAAAIREAQKLAD